MYMYMYMYMCCVLYVVCCVFFNIVCVGLFLSLFPLSYLCGVLCNMIVHVHVHAYVIVFQNIIHSNKAVSLHYYMVFADFIN